VLGKGNKERRAFVVQARPEIEAVRAGVDDVSPHDMRRTFVGDLLDAGADIAMAQWLARRSATTAAVSASRRRRRRCSASRAWRDLARWARQPPLDGFPLVLERGGQPGEGELDGDVLVGGDEDELGGEKNLDGLRLLTHILLTW
jgi:hypothetical protein